MAWVSSAWRLSEAASNSCVWRAWRASLSATALATASFTRLETFASSATRVTAGAGAGACGTGRVSEKDPQPGADADPQPGADADPQPGAGAADWDSYLARA